MGQKQFMVCRKGIKSKAVIFVSSFLVSLELERVMFPACLEARGIFQLTSSFPRAGTLWGWHSSASPVCFSLPSPWGPVLSQHRTVKQWTVSEESTWNLPPLEERGDFSTSLLTQVFLLFTPMNLAFIKHNFLWSSYREIIFPSLNVCCIFF